MENEYGAHNYHPLPVVFDRAHGSRVWDPEGKEYLDFLSAYSAVNHGHCHPAVVGTLIAQAQKLTLSSRAFYNSVFAQFAKRVTELLKYDMVLPMNTGAEAVETAMKLARKWAYVKKGVPEDKARVLSATGNFHGRTTTIVGFSDDPVAHDDFGPYGAGFRSVPFGDAAALEAAIDDDTAAVLLEPIQGEAGVVIPPEGYLRAVREICDRRGVLMIADEIQSGLGRAGTTFACDRESVVPDVYLLGKALGGGIVPLSAVVADEAVLGVLRPGEHGSTFGGNPLACAIGTQVVEMLASGEFQTRAQALGEHLEAKLNGLIGSGVTAVRFAGLWAGVDIDPAIGTGREVAEKLLARGVLVKDTHGQTIRIAPPLVIRATELDWAVEQLRLVLAG